MSWLDPVPFLRGTAWLDPRCRGRAVRAAPGALARLPWDTAQRAALPIGVRLEFTASPGTRAVEVRYRTSVPEGHGHADDGDSADDAENADGAEYADGADPLRALGHCFALWEGERCVGETCTKPEEDGAEEATVILELPGDSTSTRSRLGPFTVHPPEAVGPVVLGVRAVGGGIAPAAPRPRWVVHGDSITEGWWSTRPAHAWPAVAGRMLGVDAVNLGYAGSARGELPVAEQLAALPAELLTLAFGTNCWSGTPFSAPLLYETVRAFVALVRRGHPDTPLLLVSPVLRPDAETTPNALGATLAQLRTAMEEAVRDLVAAGDTRLSLLPGRDVLRPEHLVDGLHPDDTGHALIAAAVARALRPYTGRGGSGRVAAPPE
ncbi:GDSL-type esterase/lipase family protein [Streptomyces sp. NPDC045431]|uniref:GDSL-type esterase/lipase family protein n=1 Tax=Streptomyces sp. NPDC045431 TaxID=3155613 RepID=UPI0033E170E4